MTGTDDLRRRVLERMERDGIPRGTDHPDLLSMGATPIHGGTVTDTDDLLICVPEWCHPDDLPEHSSTCPNHLVEEPITKARLVELCHSAAEQAIDSYQIAMDPEYGFEMTPDEASEMVLDEVDEGTTCYVGIGSCGRGWCKHS